MYRAQPRPMTVKRRNLAKGLFAIDYLTRRVPGGANSAAGRSKIDTLANTYGATIRGSIRSLILLNLADEAYKMEEQSISEKAMQWRNTSKNDDMKVRDLDGYTWVLRRYVTRGRESAFVIGEEHWFRPPGERWCLSEYRHWYIMDRDKRNDIRLTFAFYSPFAEQCHCVGYQSLPVNSAEQALERVLGRLLEELRIKRELDAALNY